MKTITGGGAFTRQNIADINQNFQQIQAEYYIDGQYGYDGNPGTSPGLAFRTPQPLDLALPNWRRLNNTQQTIRVAIAGVLNYEWSTPKVNNVTLIGAGGLPRQATTSGVPNGGGATWLSPTSGTGALLQPNGQGWTIYNIFFNNSATSAGCIKLVNAGDPPTANCSEKTSIIGCILTGSDDGVAALDLPNNILIEDTTFFGFGGAGDLAISSATGAGTGTLSNWVIRNCTFNGNTGHITAPFASSEITGCKFSYIYGATTSTTQVVLTSGANNSVHHNYFDLPYSTNGITAMFALGTNDRWYWNYFSTAVTTTIASFGAPSS